MVINDLLEQAQKQLPPQEEDSHKFRKSDFVDLETVDPSFKLDIRYATDNNFVGKKVYSQAKAFLQRPAAMALAGVSSRLKSQGYGLIIYDGYRPWTVTWVFWQHAQGPQKMFVADPQQGSKHNRGCAVDVAMYRLETGMPVPFPSDFDEMTPRAFSDYEGGSVEERLHRKILREAMEAEGFEVHPHEWWHFDYKEWPHYRIENLSFESLGIR